MSTVEKEFKCTHEGCGKSFAKNEHLKNHEKTHTWRDIPSISGYEINSEGIVRRMINQRVTSQYTHVAGYKAVTIRRVPYLVHRLVMETFVGMCPKGCTVDHLDGNRTNNKLENLRYATSSEQRANVVRPTSYNSHRKLRAVDVNGTTKVFEDARKAAEYICGQEENVKTVVRKLYIALKEQQPYKSFQWSYITLDLEWIDIPEAVIGASGYKISRTGHIKLLKGRETVGFLKNGYYEVNIGDRLHKVHVLVAKSFLGIPADGMVVNHINGIKTDNRLENLEFCTLAQNSQHAVKMGLTPIPEGTKVQQKSLNDEMLTIFESLQAAAKAVSGNYQNIIGCCKGRQKTAYGFRWSYVDEVH